MADLNTQQANPQPSQSAGSTGLDQNVGSCLAYLCGWLTGLVFVLIEKNNKEVRFHAWQAIFVDVAFVAYWIAAMILGFIPIINIIIGFVSIFVGLGYFVLKVILMIKAYQGQRLSLPVISDFASKQQ